MIDVHKYIFAKCWVIQTHEGICIPDTDIKQNEHILSDIEFTKASPMIFSFNAFISAMSQNHIKCCTINNIATNITLQIDLNIERFMALCQNFIPMSENAVQLGYASVFYSWDCYHRPCSVQISPLGHSNHKSIADFPLPSYSMSPRVWSNSLPPQPPLGESRQPQMAAKLQCRIQPQPADNNRRSHNE